jgi:hypothetical protein
MNEAKVTSPTPATQTRPAPTEVFEKMEQKLPPTFKPTGESTETRALETLIADLNSVRPGQAISAEDPALEGAIGAPATTPAAAPGTGPSPVPGPTTPAPATAVVIETGMQPPPQPGFRPVSTNNFRRVFLTGRSGSGTTHVAKQVKGAMIYDLRDVAAAMAFALVMGKTPPASLPDFSKQHQGLLIVTGVDSMQEFNTLREMGFEHYHVCCSSQVLPQRPNRRFGHNEDMAVNFDQQTAQAVRQNGPNKKIVWNDPTAPLPPRLMSVAQFVMEMTARNQ